jgi:signal transduction histidine kinase
MINALLDYSRKSITEQHVEEVDVREMVEQIVQLLFLPPHVHFKINTPLPRFWTKKVKLQQVIQNLISNAYKYNNKPEGLIEMGCQEKGDFYEFYVRDNGPGIPFQDHENIFKFFRTSINMATTESSTGVGLAILKLLVEEQGGQIRVESDPASGSIFYFEWKK